LSVFGLLLHFGENFKKNSKRKEESESVSGNHTKRLTAEEELGWERLLLQKGLCYLFSSAREVI
jgi:hypothetical protein